MALTLEIKSEHREIVGDDAVREFGEDGGSIGRSLENDWILPDPDKYISGRHAVIDFKGGIYYLADLSSNGTYVNDEREPIGKGNPRRLFNGDILRFGDFEIHVTIDQGESIAMPLDEDPRTILTDNVEQLVPEVSIKTGVNLLDEEEITGDEDFQSRLFETGKEELPTLPSTEDAAEESEPETEHEIVDMPVGAPASDDELFDIFLRGIGMSRADLHPSVTPEEVMKNVGEVFKEFVDGAGKMLASRAELKSAFSLDQTTVLPRHNNPLKLSQNTEDSVMQLLVGREGEYLGPRDAVREVCRDLLFHQDAFLDAMTAAFVEFADRFDPDEIQNAFQQDGKSKPLFSFLAGNKYWQHYRDLYPVMTERGGGRFPQMFAEEFVQAYERQVNDFKRVDPSNPDRPTVKLEPLSEEEYEEEPTAVFEADMTAELEEALNEDDFDAPEHTAESDVSGEFDELDDEQAKA